MENGDRHTDPAGILPPKMSRNCTHERKGRRERPEIQNSWAGANILETGGVGWAPSLFGRKEGRETTRYTEENELHRAC